MLGNVPPDWGYYWRRCERCGEPYHLSEGGCCAPDPCEGCAYEWDARRCRIRRFLAAGSECHIRPRR